MKKKHKESFKGTEYKISGIVDIDKILILYAIILTFLFIIALGFVIFLEGWSIRYFLILGAFYLCLLVFVDGSILLGVYLLNEAVGFLRPECFAKAFFQPGNGVFRKVF